MPPKGRSRRKTTVQRVGKRPINGRRLAERLRERDVEVAGSIREFLEAPDPTPERIHRLHADLRRLRVEHRLWRSLLRAPSMERATALDRRLAEVARRVGEVRDADVQLQLLEPQARGDQEAEESPGELVRRLRDDARIGRELLRAYLQAELHAGLFDGLSATLDQPVARGALTRFPDVEVDRMRKRLQRAFRRARRKLSVRRAHFLRVRLRRSRYLIEFLGTLSGAERGSYPSRLARLQRMLGRLHDLDVLSDWIAELSDPMQGTPWATEYRAQRKNTRQKVCEELDRGALKEAIRGLGS